MVFPILLSFLLLPRAPSGLDPPFALLVSIHSAFSFYFLFLIQTPSVAGTQSASQLIDLNVN